MALPLSKLIIITALMTLTVMSSLAAAEPAATPAAELQPRSPSVPPKGSSDEPERLNYRLGPGDLLRVLVFQHPDLSMELRIHDDGHATYPLLGRLGLAGLSVGQAERLMESRLREDGYLRHPQVSLTVMQVRAHLVSVLGQVQRPGRFAVDAPGMRLSELLAQAGGITPGGADTVTLHGRRQGQPYRVQVDIAAMVSQGQAALDPTVEGGDTVHVDRAPIVYVYGEVQRPGALRMERGMTVLQALAAGGGPTLRGTTRGLRLIRRDADGSSRSFNPALDETVQGGDVLHVPQSLF